MIVSDIKVFVKKKKKKRSLYVVEYRKKFPRT